MGARRRAEIDDVEIAHGDQLGKLRRGDRRAELRGNRCGSRGVEIADAP